MRKSVALLLTATVTLVTGLITGAEVSQSGDHEFTQLVPLTFAEQRGAAQWEGGLRAQFLNDQGNLVRMSREEIQDRNDRGPADWLPASGQCDYIGKFMAVIERYELHHSHEQWQDLLVRRQRCYTQFQ